jgi:hypothetical protein
VLPSTYIPTGTLGRWLDVPFCLSQAIIYPMSSVLVCSVKLPPNYRLSLRWLSMHYIDVVTQNEVAEKLTTNMAITFAGLYSGEFEQLNLHSGQPLVYVPCDVPTYNQMDPYYWRDFEAPDTYAVLAVNNTQETQLRVSVSGSFRVTKL